MTTWKLSTTIVGGHKRYQVYRTKDPLQPDHSGNRQVVATYETETLAKIVCEQMNAKQEGGTK